MNLIIQGPQGSGKGTQVELLVKKLGLVHVDVGSLLRKHATPEVKILMDAGQLAPQEFTRKLVENFLSENQGAKGFIFDGYPRTLPQYMELKEILGKSVDAVINIEISEQESITRLGSRRICGKCGEIYNLITKPPVGENCDKCGGELVHRDDDKPESIKKRLEIYRSQTHPVFEKAVEEGIGFEVNGELPIEQVHEEIMAVVAPSHD